MLFVTAALASISLLQPPPPEPVVATNLDADMAGPIQPPPPTSPMLLDGDTLLSYTYLEIGGTVTDIDAISEDLDSYYIRGSLSLLGFLYGFIGYETQSTNFFNTDADLYRIGAGARLGLRENLDILGEIGYLYNDVSGDALSGGSSGYEIRAGARWLPIDWASGGLEFFGNGLWVDVEDRLATEDSAFGVELGARAHFIRFLSIGAQYTTFDDDSLYGLNARFSL